VTSLITRAFVQDNTPPVTKEQLHALIGQRVTIQFRLCSITGTLVRSISPNAVGMEIDGGRDYADARVYPEDVDSISLGTGLTYIRLK